MMPLLTVCGRLWFVLPLGLFVMGCTQSALQAPSPQENLGMGISRSRRHATRRPTIDNICATSLVRAAYDVRVRLHGPLDGGLS